MNKYQLLNIIFSLGIFTWLWHGMHRVKKRTTKSFHKKTWQEPKAVIQTNLVTIFLVKDTSMKKCVKDDHLSYVTATTSNMDQKLPKCYWRRLHHFCAACFGRLGFLPTMLEIFSINNLLKKTTCPRWPHYIGTPLFTTI